MSKEFDKIRILWVDDCEGQDAGYMYPERTLPEGELDRYFKIVKHPEIPGPSTLRTPRDFGACFNPFWWGKGETEIFPPEIIGMDYNLQKWIDSEVQVLEQNSEMPDFLKSEASKPAGIHVDNGSDDQNTEWAAGFEGLVLGIFISSLLHQHPIGIVPMTNYGDLLENIPEVNALHLISKEVLHVDYSEFGVSGEDRSWKNVLDKGVKALRVRIENLYEDLQIVISPSDLMALAEDADHSVLTLRSSHAVRRLPVQGLFIDVPEEKRREAIKKWAEVLMRTVMVDCEEFRRAQKLAGLVWDAYNDNTLVEDRRRLSILAEQKAAGEDYDQDEFKRLCSEALFNVKNLRTDGGHAGGKCGSGFVDITLGSNNVYSGRIRRWAALLVIYNLLKRLSLIRKEAVDRIESSSGKTLNLPAPVLTVNDLFLALFPVPESPLTVSWHVKGDSSNDQKKRDNAIGTWRKAMMRFKDKIDVAKDKGDLALSVYDVFDGSDWNENGPYGLFSAEKVVLQGIVLGDVELGASVEEREYTMRAFEDAKRIIWNERTSS